MSDLHPISGFATSFEELERRIYRAKAALLAEVECLAGMIAELPPALRYDAEARIDRLRGQLK